DDAFLIDNDWLPEPELPDRRGDGIDRGIVEARVVRVRLDRANGAHFDLHGLFLFCVPKLSLPSAYPVRPRNDGRFAEKNAAGDWDNQRGRKSENLLGIAWMCSPRVR